MFLARAFQVLASAQRGNEKMRTEINKLGKAILMISLAVFVSACAMQQKKVEKEMKAPISCGTAESDLRVLQNEKAHVAEQIAEGVTAIIPISLVVGVITRTEGTKVKVATGEYNKMIDKRIAEIKSECGR